jgi:uncharacterized protein YbjT (DUF2867 family)
LFTDAGVPTTIFHTSFYWDNFIHFGMGPKPGSDSKLALNLPLGDKKLPGMAASDIGGCAYGVFKAGGEFTGKTIGVTGEHLTGAQMAAGLSKALGQEVSYNAVPFDVYRGLGFPGADDLGNMFQFGHDFDDYFCGARPVDLSRRLNPGLMTFETWLQANKERIPLS